MIVKLLFEMILGLLELVFGWVAFPPMPAEISGALDTLLEYMSQAMGFVWLVVPRPLVLVGLPIILVVENFDKLYSIIMWILKKIPFLGME